MQPVGRGLEHRTERGGAHTDFGATTMAHTAGEWAAAGGPALPELVVFDLDMCMWSPEMYTLHKPPTIPVPGDLGRATAPSMMPAAGAPAGMAATGRAMQGVVGASNGQDTVRLFPGALAALQDVAAGKYPGMRIAAASSADNANAVACAKASLALLEVEPGLTFAQLLARGFEDIGEGNVQIGRSAPLSSDKTTHFNLLRKNTGIEFDKMLFFDDCGWSDNCAVVERGCPGVTTMKTPNGKQAHSMRQPPPNIGAKGPAESCPDKPQTAITVNVATQRPRETLTNLPILLAPTLAHRLDRIGVGTRPRYV